MRKIKTGTIVLVPFPFTDLSNSKVRPALVVADIKNGEDCIVMFISSVVGKGNENLDVKVPKSGANGLKINSVVKCAKIATLQKKIIIGEIGQLEKMYLEKVKSSVNKIFALGV